MSAQTVLGISLSCVLSFWLCICTSFSYISIFFSYTLFKFLSKCDDTWLYVFVPWRSCTLDFWRLLLLSFGFYPKNLTKVNLYDDHCFLFWPLKPCLTIALLTYLTRFILDKLIASTRARIPAISFTGQEIDSSVFSSLKYKPDVKILIKS